MYNKKLIIVLVLLVVVGAISMFVSNKNKETIKAGVNTYTDSTITREEADNAAIQQFIDYICDGKYEESYNMLYKDVKEEFKDLAEYETFIKKYVYNPDVKPYKNFIISEEGIMNQNLDTGETIWPKYTVFVKVYDDDFNSLSFNDYFGESKEYNAEYFGVTKFDVTVVAKVQGDYKLYFTKQFLETNLNPEVGKRGDTEYDNTIPEE